MVKWGCCKKKLILQQYHFTFMLRFKIFIYFSENINRIRVVRNDKIGYDKRKNEKD